MPGRSINSRNERGHAFFIGSKSVPDHDWLQAELTYALASQMTLKASMDLPDFYMRRQTDFKID